MLLKLLWNFEHLRKCFRLRDRRKIDFLIVGTQKGGTTALDSYLRSHPEICMAVQKEAHFFDDEECFQHGDPNYYKYHSLFKPNRSNRILGEATPIYMYWKSAPGRIWHYNPRMKIIIILRNPIDRAYSSWYMLQERGIDTLSFWEAIQAESQRLSEVEPYQHRFYSYIDRGFYSVQLQRIWTYFPRHQTLIILNDDLRTHVKDTLDKVCTFMDISYFRSVEPLNVFSASYVKSMTRKEREYLKNVFDVEIEKLEHLLGLDLNEWR